MKRMQDMNTADRKMARTLVFIIMGTIALVVLWALVISAKVGFGVLKGRTNPQQNGTPRVYDYADMLTDEQEEKLEKKIETAQRAISADIVIVIMNESIEAMYPDLMYMRSDETDAYRGIQRYTESYWIDQGFGWNEAGNTGNGIIMVDNIYRESNGWVYNWVAGAGDLRFSVGDENCQELSQSFTDRLPYGDMPRYSQTYADALMAFVDDCNTFGHKIRGMLGWRLYTPQVMFATIGSSLLATIIVFVLLCVIFGRMVWYMHYNGKQKKEQSSGKRRNEGFLGSAVIGVASMFILFILSSVNPVLGGPCLIVMFVVYFFTDGIPFGNGKKKKEKTEEEPFARRGMLAPDVYNITNQEDRLIKRYTTSYTESSSSGSSGGGGGGGFSSGGGGGGGGGGFSGGGSHR